MNVPWYYASNGERFGPVAWEEIRQAVDEKSLGPHDLVWSPAFGKEWRKAATLTGLFPPPEPPPTAPNEEETEGVKTAPSEDIERAVEELFQKQLAQSPFATGSESVESYDKAQHVQVNCRKAFFQAWEHTKRLIFTTFSFRRWLFLSLCVMLTLLNPQNPFAGFMSTEADNPSAKQINRLGLDEVAKSGIFKFQVPLDEESRKQFENQLSSDWATQIGSAMRETAIAVNTWFSNNEHRHHLLFAVFGIIFIYAIGIWFSARGSAMFLARLYRPDALIFATWIEADKPAGALFRGMMAIRLISLVAFLVAIRHAVVTLAALPPDLAVPQKLVLNIIRNIALIVLADKWVMGYVKDFVTPHVLLTTPKFFSAFKIALQSTGVWFIRYLLLLSIAYSALGTLLALTGVLFGMGVQFASVLIFTSPFFGALLTLPIHLIRRLWTLHIVFQLHPTLRKSMPLTKLIRVIK